ncbi:MAG: trypsin-like peptidase domain-containing protein [Candidatus Aenigmarchaeota archaeon]|nr:trypsin-like peptidase domain-containing protein [Candidatus Aenigmarchaeota archaeon]
MKKFRFVLIVLFLVIINSTIVFAQIDTETNQALLPEILPTEIIESIIQKMSTDTEKNQVLSPEILPTEIRESIIQRMVMISVINKQKDGELKTHYGQGILIQSNMILTVKHLVNETELNSQTVVMIYFYGTEKTLVLRKKDTTYHSSANIDSTIIKLDKLTKREKSTLPQVEPIKFSTVQPTETVFMPCFLRHQSDDAERSFWVKLFFSGTIVNTVLTNKDYLYINIPASQGISGSGVFNKKGQLTGLAFAYFQINPDIRVAVAINNFRVEQFLKTIRIKDGD